MGVDTTLKSLVESMYFFNHPQRFNLTRQNRFERELEALRKELAESTARSGSSSRSESDLSSLDVSPNMINGGLPNMTPRELSPELESPPAYSDKKNS